MQKNDVLGFISFEKAFSIDLNFPHFFCQLSLKMFGRQQMATFAVLHVENDDQVRRLGKHKLHNNNIVIRKALYL
jgi:hypothetical protein